MVNIAKNLIDLIGNTPLLELTHLQKGMPSGILQKQEVVKANLTKTFREEKEAFFRITGFIP